MKINATAVTASVVAGAAFLASAQHIYSVAYEAGNPWAIAWIHAIGIDGLILIGINALGKARTAAVISISYGAIVSLVFNAASYGAFEMSPLALAASMPTALVLAYVTQHASRQDKDTGRGTGTRDTKATRTEVDVRVRRERVQAVPRDTSQDNRPVVQATVSHPVPAMSGEVVPPVSRPAIERKRVPMSMSDEQLQDAMRMINAGGLSDRMIAASVFEVDLVQDVTEAQRKRVERLRKSLETG